MATDQGDCEGDGPGEGGDAKGDVQAVLVMLCIMTVAVVSIGVYVFGFREHEQQLDTLGDLNALQAGRHLFRAEPEPERDAHVMPRKMTQPCKPPEAICDPMPVLCTVGGEPSYRQSIILPPLGYCSIIFYKYITRSSIDANGTTRSGRLDEFLHLAKQNSGWSEFGVAFDYWFAEGAAAMLSEPNGTRMLAPFEENGVVHYGVLNDWSGWSYNVLHHKATLNLFRVLRQHQRQRDAGRPYLLGGIVYAVRMLPSYNKQQLDMIDHIVKDFKVDMLVATTHMEETYQYTFDCRITGPTTWDHKYDSHELPIIDVIKRISDRGYLDLNVPVAVSFTLKGFWYRPEKNAHEVYFAPGKPCGYIVGDPTVGSYTEVCENTTYQSHMTTFEEGHFFNYTFCRECDRTFVFDTLSSITQKVVLAHRAHRGLSFALFDIDYEDVFNLCPDNLYGAFDRVAAVRWLTDRFKELRGAAVSRGLESPAS